MAFIFYCLKALHFQNNLIKTSEYSVLIGIVYKVIYLTVLYIIFTDLFLIITKFLEINHIFNANISDMSICVNDENLSKVHVDRPVSKWPAGSTQAISITSAAYMASRRIPAGPLQKGATAIGAGTIMAAVVGYFHAVEHPNGFNNIINKVSSENKDSVKMDGKKTISKFTSDDDSTISDILAEIVKALGMEPKPTDLPFDVLVNQHLAIIYLLFFIVVGILLLTIVFTITCCLYYYRDYFLKNFKNYYVNLYIRYQILLAKIFFYNIPYTVYIKYVNFTPRSLLFSYSPYYTKLMFINFYIVVLFCKIAPALNLANCWKMQKYFAQSAVPFIFYKINGIFRDYTPSSICSINSFLKIPAYKYNVLKKKFYLF